MNITCLGSAEGVMQDARFESGLDNSPMYDDWPNDFMDNKMRLYDVGMSSMHAMDTQALAQLARILNKTEEAT